MSESPDLNSFKVIDAQFGGKPFKCELCGDDVPRSSLKTFASYMVCADCVAECVLQYIESKPRSSVPERSDRAQVVESVLIPDVCTADVLAKYLKLSQEEVISAIEAGDIPAKNVGGRWLVSGERLREMLGGS